MVFSFSIDVGAGLGAINRGLLAVVVAGVFGLAGAVPRGVRVQVPDLQVLCDSVCEPDRTCPSVEMLTEAISVFVVAVTGTRNNPPAVTSTSPPVLPRAFIAATSTSFCPVIVLEPAFPDSEPELITPVAMRPGATIEISPPVVEPKASTLPDSRSPALRILISPATPLVDRDETTPVFTFP